MSKAADAFGRVKHNVEEDGDGDGIDGGEEEDEGDEIDGGEEEEGDDEEEVVEVVDDENGDGVEIVEEVEVVEDGDDDDEDEDRDDDDDESDEEEGEGDPDADLFGPDNAEYMQTTAQSRLKPPRLPPPQFPRKQDYRDARNGHIGGRYNDKGPPSGGRFGDKGGQGRFNDKGPPQRALLPTPPVWQAGMGWPGRSGQSQGNEALVADMKLGAVGHQDEVLRSKCPQFQEPSQIACYSRTADGNVHFDERCLRRFRRAVLTEIGADLNEGYESFVAKKDAGNEGFGDLLACLRTKRISLDNIHFVTFRNNLNKILGTAYNRFEAWKMGVHKRCGTVYLDVHKLPETQNDFQQRSSYWGYSFERLATEDPSVSSSGSGNSQSGRQKSNGTSRSNVGAVDANVEYCAVIRTKLGAHRIVMGAEMDCFEGNPDGKRHYIELKTSRELAGHTVDKFEREKLLKFWIQSFLAGVSRIVVGFRDDSGHLVRTEVMGLKEITNRVKAKHHWEGGVCLAFADRVLCWLYGTVKENEDYVLRFAPQFNRLELLKAHSCPQIISKHVEELDQTAQPQ